MNTDQRKALWQKIQYQLHPASAHALMPEDKPTTQVWYVRLMLGTSAWLAAVFVFLFMWSSFEFVIKQGTGSVVAGLLLLAVAWRLFQFVERDFMVQFGLALGMAGQGLLLHGLHLSLRRNLPDSDDLMFYATLFLLELFLLILPNFISRLACSLAALYALTMMLEKTGFVFMMPCIAALGLVLWWRQELALIRHASLLTPICIGLLSVLILFGVHPAPVTTMVVDWGGLVPQIAVLLALAWVIVQHARAMALDWRSPAGLTLLLACTLFGLLACQVPGLGEAGLIIVLGFATGNRLLLALGCCVLAWYVGRFYYDLQSTLLMKSLLMFASGALLLLARQAMRQYFPLEQTHA